MAKSNSKKEKQDEIAVKAEEAVKEAANEAVNEAPEIDEAANAAENVITADGTAALTGFDEENAGKSSANGPKPHKKVRISYEKKKRLYGYIFIALWFVGTIYMFIIPLAQSVRYSLSKTTVVSADDIANNKYEGMKKPGILCEWNNFGNYDYIFNTDPDYVPRLLQSIQAMPGDTFMIIVFSMFLALMLNQKFRGRTLARAIFFLPVLVATGPVLSVINGEVASQGVGEASQFSSLFQIDMVDSFLEFMGFSNISHSFANELAKMASNLFNMIWRCGIQTIIFLSAMQQIPTSAKEAAQMEGATGWEFFWKITFPTISPMILANVIYTVIDVFIDANNPVMYQVLQRNLQWQYDVSTAMAWTYFGIVGVALGIVSAIISKFVFYQVD